MTDNFVDVLRELEQSRIEVEELRAALRRLVLAADAERRTIERDLHDGVRQHLIALAVNLQLAAQAAASDPVGTRTRLEEIGHDVQDALDEAALLARRIYPATLEGARLGALLRSAAVTAGVPASVDVIAPSNVPPEVALTLYFCWLDLLAGGDTGTRATINVRESEDMIVFELVGKAARSDADHDNLRHRVEALGGRLTISSGSRGATRVSGSLPLSR